MFIILFIWREEIHFNKTRYLLFFLNKTNKQMLKRNETIPWYSNPSRPYHHSSSPSIPSNHDLWMEILHFSKPSCWFSPIWLAYSNLEKSWEILTVSKHHRNKKKKLHHGYLYQTLLMTDSSFIYKSKTWESLPEWRAKIWSRLRKCELSELGETILKNQIGRFDDEDMNRSTD